MVLSNPESESTVRSEETKKKESEIIQVENGIMTPTTSEFSRTRLRPT